MALGSYSTGTISIDAGGTVVNGAGVLWSNIKAGDTLVVAGHSVLIEDWTDNTHLTIDAWPYSLVSAATYKIIFTSPLRFAGGAAMADVSKIVGTMNTDGFYVFVRDDETVPDPSLGEDGQYARKPTTKEEWYKDLGVWVYQGVFGTFSASSDPWDSVTTFTKDVIVPWKGILWRSLQASNLNHQPDLSPTWWAVFLAGGDAYDIVNFDTDRPADNELVLKVVFTKTVTFYAGLTESKASADVGATNTAVYTFKKNGVSFGTATFASGGSGGSQVATFTSAANAAFVPGDILTIYAPITRDPTLSGIGITLSGFRN